MTQYTVTVLVHENGGIEVRADRGEYAARTSLFVTASDALLEIEAGNSIQMAPRVTFSWSIARQSAIGVDRLLG